MASIDSVKLPDGTEYNINEKLASFTNANLVEVDANGNLKDSGIAKSTIGNKQNKTLDTAVESQTTVEGALGALSSNKQPKTMSATVESQTTVEGALGALSSNKQPKTMSASVESQSTVEGALGALSSNKQPKTLATAITVDGTSETTVEGALGAINTLAASNKTALASKQNSSITPITIEGTSRSTVETALAGLNTYADDLDDAIDAITNVYSAKNLARYPYDYSTSVVNGITFTDNGDGTVTVSGTASADAFLCIIERGAIYNPLHFDAGSYIVSGCPSGGSENTYYLVATSDSYTSTEGYKDTGEGKSFSVTAGGSDAWHWGLTIVVKSGTVITTPITFKPMLRDARIPDPTWRPYAMTNRELTEDARKTEIVDISSLIAIDSTKGSGSAKAFYYPKTKTCFISISFKATTTCDYDEVVCTFPPQYLPTSSRAFPCMYIKNNAIEQGGAALTPQGGIQMMSANGYSFFYGSGVITID